MSMNSKPAVFLDRDGTILKEIPYLDDPSQATLLPGVGESLSRLQDAGFLLLVVTNQSGIARGLLDEGDLTAIHAKVDSLLEDFGTQIDGWYHCPHHNAIGQPPQRRRCRCRKPLPGLIEQAMSDFEVDLSRSAGMGDDIRDLQAFAAMGIPGVLVGTGKGLSARQKLAEQGREPDLFCAHIAEAVPWLCRRAAELQHPEKPRG